MKVFEWARTHRVVASCAAGALVLTIGGGIAWGVMSAQTPTDRNMTTPVVETTKPTPTKTPTPTTTATATPSTEPSPTATREPTKETTPAEPAPPREETREPDAPVPQPPAPPAPEPPASEPPPPPPPPPEPEAPRGDANAELAARYGTNHNGITRCGNANSGSATSAASLPPWGGVGNVGWSLWIEGDRWHVQYMSCE